MASIESIKTNIDWETNGKWVDYYAGIELLIARSGNPAYNECMRSLVEPITEEIRDDKTTVQDWAALLLKVRAKTVLLGWRNLDDKEGNPIPYSAEKAEEFFNDPELKDFYKFVRETSESAETYLKRVAKETLGN